MHILETIETLLKNHPKDFSPIRIHEMLMEFDAFEIVEDVAQELCADPQLQPFFERILAMASGSSTTEAIDNEGQIFTQQ